MTTTTGRFWPARLIAVLLACWALSVGIASAQDESITELLEQAIYTEETEGDLTKAVELYKKVVEDARVATSAAAKAQFRLAQCLAKLGKHAEAEEAFAKVISDYPTEEELVKQAKSRMSGAIQLLPVPWTSGELQELTMRLANGLDIGRQFIGVHEAKEGDRPAWRFMSRQFVTLSAAHSSSWVLVDAETQRPLRSHWNHTLLGEATAVYQADKVTVTRQGEESGRDVAHHNTVFDNEQGMQLMRVLPLADDYSVVLPIFTSLGSGLVTIEVKVVGREKVTTGLGELDCYRVHLNVGQDFWVSTDEHRYIAKFEAGGASAVLTRVSTMKLDAPTQFESEELGLSLELPPGWLASIEATPDEDRVVHLFDPHGDGFVSIRTSPSSDTPLERLMEQEAEKVRTVSRDFQVLDDKTFPTEIGGKPVQGQAMSFNVTGNTMVKYSLYVRGERLDYRLVVVASEGKFSELRPAVDKIWSTVTFK